MSREPQVTRTIQNTKVKALCINITEQKPFETEFTLPRTYKDSKHIMKAISAEITDSAIKVVHVISSEVTETLYGMSETDFIKYATVLPPRATL